MCPQSFKRRGEQLTFTTPLRVGPKTLANPKPTGVGKRGSRGAKPPGGGLWGVSPHKPKRGEQLTPGNPATSGTQNAGKPSQRGWANGGPGGEAPMAGGVGGVPPRNFKRGSELAPLPTKTTSGTQNTGEPSANEGGKMEVQGAKPPGGGCGGCPPTKL
jgi:hypothetical protein